MGMDVFGNEPTSEAGEYFRNNVWWWRHLWGFCCTVAPDLTEGVSGQTNDGDGLDGPKAHELAERLQEAVDSGVAADYEAEFKAGIDAMPHEKCEFCDATGIRQDMFADKELTIEQAKELGRTQGWCNGCDGRGTRPPFAASYRFSVENVVEFIGFLRACGGFKIC